jgi:hypothetical protein
MRHAFQKGWPEAELCNLLDDDLMPAYTRAGGLTPHIVERICELALYAARTGADGILFTCSVFPQAEDLAKQLVPVPPVHIGPGWVNLPRSCGMLEV